MSIAPVRIVLVGAGGTGIPVLIGLATAWREAHPLEIYLVDGDRVSLSNLNRQILFSNADLGRPKASTAAIRLIELFPTVNTRRVTIQPFDENLTERNLRQLLKQSHVVIDATDSPTTKLLTNDYCVTSRTNYCYTGAVADHGLVLALDYDHYSNPACLRCLFESMDDADYQAAQRSCHSAGIWGPVAGVIGFSAAHSVLQLLAPENFAAAKSPSATDGSLIRFSLSRDAHRRLQRINLVPSSTCRLGCAKRTVVPLDLTDLECPATFLYTKVAIERLTAGEELLVHFNNAQSTDRVARTCDELGYGILRGPRALRSGQFDLLLSSKRSFEAGTTQHPEARYGAE